MQHDLLRTNYNPMNAFITVTVEAGYTKRNDI